MKSEPQLNAVMRDMADLLALGLESDTLWEAVCRLLAKPLDASSVAIVLQGDDGAVYELAGDTLAKRTSWGDNHRFLEGILTKGKTESAQSAGHSLAGAPVRFKTHVVGALAAQRQQPFSAEMLQLIESCAVLLAPSVQADERSGALERMAFSDALTGIANRRRFDDALATEWQRCARDATALTVLMIDIDYFKAFNDTYGHQAGDHCLREVALAMRSCVNRPADLLARYGGEEFVALLPSTTVEGGVRMAECLREQVAAVAIKSSGSTLGRVSISIGIASMVPNAQDPAAALVQKADGALYRAKLAGRNRAISDDYESLAETANRNIASAPYQLPERKSAIIGRDTELRELQTLVENNSLVTIVAFGGIGKTRLAIEVAAKLGETFADGVHFLELASSIDAGDLPSQIAAALGVQLRAGNALETLPAALRGKKALLLLDNCEHLVAGVAPLAASLAVACPSIHILATSRETLGVNVEVPYRLSPLALPEADANLSATAAQGFGAVALFLARARAVRWDFALTDENVADVVRICAQLEGIALAIELAVPRLRVFNVAELAQKLSEHLRVLNLGSHDGVARQQTIRALIAWSYDALSPQAQVLFRRLSVFAGGWNVEAASAVCAGEPVDAWDVFDMLFVLVEKSLVMVATSAHSRYRMLEPVREFSLEKCEEAGESDAVIRRLVDYFSDLGDRADATGWTAEGARAFFNIGLDLDNFRRALKWSLREGNDIAAGAMLAASLSRFWFFARDEGRRWIELAADRIDRAACPEIEARLDLAFARIEMSSAAETREGAQRAVRYYREHANDIKTAEALYHLAMTVALYYPDERATAEQIATESLNLARSVGAQHLTAMALRASAQCMDPRDLAGRRAALLEALALSRGLENNERIIVTLLMSSSELEFEAGDVPAALVFGSEAVQAAQATRAPRFIAFTKTNVAHYAFIVQEWELGLREASQAIRIAESTQDQYGLTLAIHALASIKSAIGEPERAARLMGFCDVRFGALHAPRQEGSCEEVVYASVMQRLRSELGGSMQDLFSDGAALTHDAAIALAVEG